MYADELSGALTRVGAEVHKIDYVSVYPAKLFPGGGSTVSKSNEAVLHWARPRTWRIAARIARQLVHLQYWNAFTSLMLLTVLRHAHKLGKAVIVTVHNPTPHERLPGLAKYEDALLEEADVLIVHTIQGRDVLRQRLAKRRPASIVVIPHGVRLHGIEPPSEEDYALTGLNPVRRYVVTFGNLRGYKGIPTLLRAWKSVCTSIDGVDLVLAGRAWTGGHSLAGRFAARLLGSGRVAETIDSLAEDESIAPRLRRLTGFVPERTLDALCRIAILGVFAHERMTGQSGAAARAAGWGTPLVVTAVGGLADLAPNPGHVVRPGDDRALAETLTRLLTSDSTSELRAAQFNAVRRYDWVKIADEHLRLYREVAVS